MKRAMVIGSPGTGKSTFAQKLAGKSGLPLIHLDFYYHDSAQDYVHDKASWKARVKKLIEQDSWIIDGNYGSTMAERMAQADTIFYFDMPRRLAMWGVLKRRFNASRIKRTDMPDDWKEMTEWSFLKYVWTFKKQYAEDTKMLLDRNRDKNIIVFQSHEQVEAYLRQFISKV